MQIDIDERVIKARNFFTSGYNCAQAVALAYDDIIGAEGQTIARLTASFGGGMSRLREVCGAVSGMAFVAGSLIPADNPLDIAAKRQNYALMQSFAEAFRKENGSIVCRELLGLSQQKDEPTPSERTTEYYRKRPCVEYVATAARIIGEHIAGIETKHE
ncbi:MAG: C_GCAxxG_C_C family protein [Rikenellaceae bacterium]|nr:C_GCAxxG_C_C family protein [Rikenellaceae bacterium]